MLGLRSVVLVPPAIGGVEICVGVGRVGWYPVASRTRTPGPNLDKAVLIEFIEAVIQTREREESVRTKVPSLSL